MSKQAMEAILGRCVMDDDYSTLLFAHPDQALASYELTKEERAALLVVDAETLEAVAQRVGGIWPVGSARGRQRGRHP